MTQPQADTLRRIAAAGGIPDWKTSMGRGADYRKTVVYRLREDGFVEWHVVQGERRYDITAKGAQALRDLDAGQPDAQDVACASGKSAPYNPGTGGIDCAGCGRHFDRPRGFNGHVAGARARSRKAGA